MTTPAPARRTTASGVRAEPKQAVPKRVRKPKQVSTGLNPRNGAQNRSGRKFFNEPCEVDGIKFDSKAEAARYAGLCVALRMGEIRDLEVHPKFPIVVHEQDCGYYEADFSYIIVASGDRVVEDVKSPVTRKLAVYRLKIKQVWALYGIRVREVVV